ncbi:MAG: RluA family pseudouridine synthase [Gammaproteobacteria bacterium]|nr:RluA family pseudouridine synthase [Gammaproteobacteria bacterium]
MRAGVRHVAVDDEGAGQRLDRQLARLLPGVPRSRLFRLIRRGEVRVNGRRAQPEQRLKPGDDLRLPPVHEAPAAGPVRAPRELVDRIVQAVISEDERLIVIDKPAGVAVHGGSGVGFGVIEALRAARPGEELELVHRLDRDTSGCLLVARRRSVLRTLHALLREGGGFDKRYLALVQGHWNLGARRIEAPLRTDLRVGGERTVRVHASGKAAVSRFRPVQFFGREATLVEVGIDTGRTHQIRVHAAYAGHPVAGDPKYGEAAFNALMRAHGLGRMFLHAHSVSFVWPESGVEFSVNAPLPSELGSVLDRLASATAGRRRARRAQGT